MSGARGLALLISEVIVRLGFNSCSGQVLYKVWFGSGQVRWLSKPGRTRVEAYQKESRSGIEGLSKPRRRIVEAVSKPYRRTVEEMHNLGHRVRAKCYYLLLLIIASASFFIFSKDAMNAAQRSFACGLFFRTNPALLPKNS